MAKIYGNLAQYHQTADVATVLGQQIVVGQWPPIWNWGYWTYSFDFQNFFHPYVGALINKLNQTDVPGMLSSSFLGTLADPYTFAKDGYTINPTNDQTLTVTLEPRDVDTNLGGPYGGYNWELLYHLPVAVAVHLSNNQRFAEAQKWFHLVFDPTNTDLTDSGAATLLDVVRLQRRRAGGQHPIAARPAQFHRSDPGRGQAGGDLGLRRDHEAARSIRSSSRATGRARSSGMS